MSALPTILLISAIIIEVGVLSVILANTLNSSRFNERLAAEAYSAARAGADDATLKVIRYKDCPATPGCPASSTIAVGSRSADVIITDSGGGIITIESTGDALGRKKKIEVKLYVDSITGEVSVQSLKEVAS